MPVFPDGAPHFSAVFQSDIAAASAHHLIMTTTNTFGGHAANNARFFGGFDVTRKHRVTPSFGQDLLDGLTTRVGLA